VNEKDIQPLASASKKGSLSDRNFGISLIQAGKCAAVVLAGGVGSRLRFEHPKGCFPITLFKKKTLYQLLAEKVRAASKLYGTHLEIAFMTSPYTSLETENYFRENDFFGLEKSQIHFFEQPLLPLQHLNGEPFYEAPGKMALGPSGNGEFYASFAASEVHTRWKKRGVEMVQLLPVDNALADPFDPEFFGFHKRQNNEITLKVVLRREAKEKAGCVVERSGKVEIVEYTDLLPEQNDLARFPFANVGLYCFSMGFLEGAAHLPLPLHQAKKATPFWNEKGEHIFPQTPNTLKFERFIFDLFPHSSRSSVLLYPREETFAPLKNSVGEDSITQVQAALLEQDRRTFCSLSGKSLSEGAKFELSADFYYPSEGLKARWKGKELPMVSYIEDQG
jgi:UDP-N-acetylglucosamine/UDP-N-acetylgalactosamine diphosphorylase